MTTALFGLLSATLAAVVHGGIVRWLPKSLQLLSIPAFGLGAAILLCTLAGDEIGIENQLLIVVAGASLGVAYMFAFVGVLYDSPTLAIANAILDHGPEGMPEDAFDEFISRNPATASRISSLLATGLLTRDTNDRLLLGSISPFMRLTAAYRRLCGLQSSTG